MKLISQNYMIFALILALQGCSIVSPRPEETKKLFQLEISACKPATSKNRVKSSLLVARTLASPMINSNKIVFRNGSQFGAYQFSAWTVAPPERLTDLLVERFECGNKFSAVSKYGDGLDPGLLLRTEILDFYHATDPEPGIVQIKIRAELSSRGAANLFKTKTFEVKEAVGQFDASGAVLAFNSGLDKALSQITEWVSNQH